MDAAAVITSHYINLTSQFAWELQFAGLMKYTFALRKPPWQGILGGLWAPGAISGESWQQVKVRVFITQPQRSAFWMSFKASTFPPEPVENTAETTPWLVNLEQRRCFNHWVYGNFLWSDVKLTLWVRSRVGRNNSERKKRTSLFTSVAPESYLCSFSILEKPTVDLWRYLSGLDLKAWGRYQNECHRVMWMEVLLFLEVFVFCKWEIISWVIIIQHQICNIWIEILLMHQAKKKNNNNILLFFLLSLDFLECPLLKVKAYPGKRTEF